MQRRHRPPLQQVEQAKTRICMFSSGVLDISPYIVSAWCMLFRGRKDFCCKQRFLDCKIPRRSLVRPRPCNTRQLLLTGMSRIEVSLLCKLLNTMTMMMTIIMTMILQCRCCDVDRIYQTKLCMFWCV